MPFSIHPIILIRTLHLGNQREMIELPLKRPFSDSYVDGGENSGGQLDTVYLHSNHTHEPPRDTVTMVNRRLRRPYPFTEINLSPDHSARKGVWAAVATEDRHEPLYTPSRDLGEGGGSSIYIVDTLHLIKKDWQCFSHLKVFGHLKCNFID